MYTRPVQNSGRTRQFGGAPGGASSLGRIMQPQQRPMPAAPMLPDQMQPLHAPPIVAQPIVAQPMDKTTMDARPLPMVPGSPASMISSAQPIDSDMNASSYMRGLGGALNGAFPSGPPPPPPPAVQQMPPEIAAAYGMPTAAPPPWAPATFPGQPGSNMQPQPQPGPMPGAGAPAMPGPAATPGGENPSQAASPDPRKQQMNQMAAMQRGRQPAAY